MARTTLALAAITALIGPPALAADMAVKAPMPAPVPAWSWAGFYVGLNGGYGRGTDPVSFSPTDATAAVYFTVGAVPASVTTSPKGGLFGGQIGYNYQWSSFVAGIEADFDAANITGTGAVSTPGELGFDPFTTAAQQKLTGLGTLRARFGIAADRALFYATGGLAYGRTQLNTSVISAGSCGPGGLCASASQTQWQPGWAAGGGAEWAFAPTWSLRVEYLHYDLGSHSQDQFDPADVFPVPVVTFTSAATFRGNIMRGGISYLFH
jgi:outer membrane immunogenic protein